MYVLRKGAHTTPTTSELARLYAYPDQPAAVSGCHVRANMVTSLDGAASSNGASAALGSDGDRAIFTALRGLCDVVLVGAGTVTAESYHAIEPDPDVADLREHNGQSAAPIIAVVSASLSLAPDSDAARAPGTVLFASAGADARRRRTLADAGAEIVDCGDDHVDLSAVLAHLAGIGRWRVLCEGGPTLLGGLISADLLDELCLTTGPTLVAGDAGRIAVSHQESGPRHLRPTQLLTDDDGFLYSRWTRPTP
ncbi:dihydrofolate reductase family protein [Williamsia sterculiae]|uniref:Pyrimidine reductase, riboflavin biosynthesis n=1 Tax=Williamsia sterculiae TaxID=1344003 RepID=A0A1N7EFI5_9NOCA|nr:dihydrofolate reductase family protein [Williamsia sterculiae]SIR86923.1 Pyrimidine reductase, riboflavin biosynthesis [Williamsia sterculiae]